MNAAKMTLVSTVVAAALGLAPGLMATPAQAHHCKGAHDFPGCTLGGGGAGGGGGGGTTPIVAEIMDINGSDLVPDNGPYSDSERDIKANAGPGIFINLRGTGNDPREVTVNVTCDNPTVGEGVGVIIGDGCDFLDGLDRQTFGVPRADVSLAARAYAVNCPDPSESGNCLDVFSLSDGTTAQMGFTVFFDEGVRLDIASAIGGTTAKNPGRCLSILTQAERSAFLAASCGDADDCNVTVMAMGVDLDGRNNSWDIVAANDTGLICNFFPDVFVIGVATGVTFFIEADVD